MNIRSIEDNNSDYDKLLAREDDPNEKKLRQCTPFRSAWELEEDLMEEENENSSCAN